MPRICSLTLSILLTAVLSTESDGGVIVNAVEAGGDVVFSGGGTLDTTGLTFLVQLPNAGNIRPAFPIVVMGPPTDEQTDIFSESVNAPLNFVLKLAEIYAEESQIPLWLDANLELVENSPGFTEWATRYRKLQRQFKDVDVHVSRREAIKLCDQVAEEFGDVLESPRTSYGPEILQLKRGAVDALTQSDRRSLSALVAPLKFGLNNLAIGQIPPDIQGPDAFGDQRQLSQQRGKVTVLMFSFKGCGPCEEMYPSNRKLVEKYDGRPFALLGVMGDDERDTVKEAVTAGKITWPVWWDGGKRGPIHRQWNVTAWPEIYVMDHRGVIRFRELNSDLLELAVSRLIKQAEASQ
jgi:peroxiredoxin